MNIILDPVEIMISGNVELDIFDQNRNTKQHQEFSNAIHADLKSEIQDAMQADAVTDFFIHTGSSWFTNNLPIGDGQNSKDGIIISQDPSNDTWTYEDAGVEHYELCLSENKSTTYGSSNNVVWQAETTWTGIAGSGTVSSDNFNKMQIGNSFDSADQSGFSNNVMQTHDHFDTVFATATHSGDFTQFVLDDNDIARVTWTITIS